MFPNVMRFCIQAGLPSCRNTGEAAEGNEQNGLYTAVTFPVNGHVFCDAVQGSVVTHEGVLQLAGNVVIDEAGNLQWIGFIADDFCS